MDNNFNVNQGGDDGDQSNIMSIFGKMKGLVTGIFTKWLYTAIAIPAMIIAYNFFKAFNTPDKNGKTFFNKCGELIVTVVEDVKHISYECPPLIEDFNKFVECLGF